MTQRRRPPVHANRRKQMHDPELEARIRAAGKRAGADVRAVFERKKREREQQQPLPNDPVV